MIKDICLLTEAISHCKVVYIEYIAANGNYSERRIEPLILYFDQGKWKLFAQCRLRESKRLFFVERIKKLIATNDNFPPHQFTIDPFLN